MTPERRDEIAELIWAFVKYLPKAEQKTEAAVMLNMQADCVNEDAWAMVVRGKSLARQKGERV